MERGPEETGRARRRFTDRTVGRWGVRLLAGFGVLLVAIACFGWWLDSRVLDDDGFADVVAKASQRQAVRDYIADQATLRLARSSNFVSAARGVVTDAVSSAIATTPVEDAVREFATRAHKQVFQTRQARRVDIDSQQAATTIRSALRTINPSLSKKLPANILDASATVSQNRMVDTLFQISHWVWLWLPIGLIGLGLLALALIRARDRVRAIRTVGIAMALGGAFIAGFGSATPLLASLAGTTDPGRGEAVATFVDTLTGRLVGSGQALVLLGLAIALAPGRDGGDLRDRARRFRAFIERKRTNSRWRFAGGIGLVVLAALVLTQPADTAGIVIDLVAVAGLYVGVVICLRASGLLVTDHAIPPLHKRQLVGVGAVMVAGFVLTAGVAVAIVSGSESAPRANPSTQGCNGFIDLCYQQLDQLVWPAAHNSMSSAAYNFFGAEHTITIPEQLNAGARFLMLDAYYGYDDDGVVRTNLAGGVDRKRLEQERGPDSVRALDRLGALTGAADTSGKKQDVYFCHDFCELGAVKAVDVLGEVRQFLERNLTDVVALDFEDYVKPADMKRALTDAGLDDRVLTLTAADYSSKVLADLVVPNKGETEKKRRLIVMNEKQGGKYPWLPKAYSLFQETPFTFSSIQQFNCGPNRGAADNPLFLINHWLRTDGPPDPTAASKINSRKTLTERFTRCATERDRLPNVVAVDFTAIGDFYATMNRFNAAVAEVTGVHTFVDQLIDEQRKDDKLSAAELAELRGVRRLPTISEEDARTLLGPVAGRLQKRPPFTRPDLGDRSTPTSSATAPSVDTSPAP